MCRLSVTHRKRFIIRSQEGRVGHKAYKSFQHVSTDRPENVALRHHLSSLRKLINSAKLTARHKSSAITRRTFQVYDS
jgi:hypothetical protein